MKTAPRIWRPGPQQTALLRRDGDRLWRTLLCIAALSTMAPLPLLAQASMSEAGRGVVRIFAVGNDGLGTGSGLVINNAGYVITNHHVIAGAHTIKVMTSTLGESLVEEVDRTFGEYHGRVHEDQLFVAVLQHIADRLADAEVVMADERRDFAILRTSGMRDYATLPFALSPQVSIGQDVRAFGYPGSGDRAGVSSMLRLKISNGIIKSVDYVNALERPVYMTTAEIHRGNSGGPLVTMCGEVVGLNTFGLRTPDGEEEALYAVQIDPVAAELTNRGIDYRTVASACVAAASPGVPTWMLYLSVLLGGSALIMTMTQRGRTAVKRGMTRIGNSIASGRGRPAGGSPGPRIPPPPPPPVVVTPRVRPVLYALSGPYKDSSLELGDEPLTIGRDPRVSQLVFPPEVSVVSKRHCKLTFSSPQRQFTLEDCWSTNGTYLGTGKRIEPDAPQTLRPGDRFYVGDQQYLFEVRLEDQ